VAPFLGLLDTQFLQEGCHLHYPGFGPVPHQTAGPFHVLLQQPEPIPHGLAYLQAGMQHSQRSQILQSSHRLEGQRVRLGKDIYQLIPHPRVGELAHDLHLNRPAGKHLRLELHPEAVALLEAHRPENAGGVLDEAKIVQDAYVPPLQVPQAPEIVQQLAETFPGKGYGHGIDGEVPAVEVLAYGGHLHRGQGGRVLVELGPGRGHVDPAPGGKYNHRRSELAVAAHPALQ